MADKANMGRGPKDVLVKTRLIARTMVAGTAVAVLPKGARIIALILNGKASDAGTTATISIGTTSTSNELVSAYDVKTAATGSGSFHLAGVVNALGAALQVDTQIFVKYAETGGASTVGNWTLSIVYTAGNITNDDTI